jgi:hypothetical protein
VRVRAGGAAASRVTPGASLVAIRGLSEHVAARVAEPVGDDERSAAEGVVGEGGLLARQHSGRSSARAALAVATGASRTASSHTPAGTLARGAHFPAAARA